MFKFFIFIFNLNMSLSFNSIQWFHLFVLIPILIKKTFQTIKTTFLNFQIPNSNCQFCCFSIPNFNSKFLKTQNSINFANCPHTDKTS